MSLRRTLHTEKGYLACGSVLLAGRIQMQKLLGALLVFSASFRTPIFGYACFKGMF